MSDNQLSISKTVRFCLCELVSCKYNVNGTRLGNCTPGHGFWRYSPHLLHTVHFQSMDFRNFHFGNSNDLGIRCDRGIHYECNWLEGFHGSLRGSYTQVFRHPYNSH